MVDSEIKLGLSKRTFCRSASQGRKILKTRLSIQNELNISQAKPSDFSWTPKRFCSSPQLHMAGAQRNVSHTMTFTAILFKPILSLWCAVKWHLMMGAHVLGRGWGGDTSHTQHLLTIATSIWKQGWCKPHFQRGSYHFGPHLIIPGVSSTPPEQHENRQECFPWYCFQLFSRLQILG